MLLLREQALKLKKYCASLENKQFNIKTQYKLIKIQKALQEEEAIYQEQIQKNCEQYFEKDENGKVIVNKDGGVKIQKDRLTECYNVIKEIDELPIQIPDIYFSIEELEPLNPTYAELQLFEPFIK